ncbi:MAG TPA: EpsG family protein [Pseudogracilibacillus sp.]|nr:EpsG family protein [Pseudogracilibacillus sp.]
MDDFNSVVLYIGVFSASVLTLLFSQYFWKINIVYYRFYIVISLLIPSIFVGLRYKVGTDYETYVIIYNKVNQLTYIEFLNTNNYEVGFFTLEKLSHWVGDVQFLFFLSSFLTLLFLYFALKQYIGKLSITLGYILYIFTVFPDSLNAVRQQLAIAIIVFSLKYIFEKKLIKFIIYVFLASTFHITAIIVIPFYFLFHYSGQEIDRKDKYKIVLRVLFLISIVIFIASYGYFLDLTAKLSGVERFSEYSNESGTGNNREIILNFFILLIMLFMRRSLIIFDGRNKLYIYFLIVGFLLSLSSIWNPIVSRMASYFDIALIFLIPSLVASLETSLSKYIGSLLVCMYSIFYFILVYYTLGFSEIIPYNIK